MIYTSTRQLRKAFKEQFKGILDFKKIKSGNERIYKCDTRCSFNDWIDQLNRDNQISDRLANQATLD